MLFETIKAIFSMGGLILKILKIVLLLAFLWFVFCYLNNKFSIFKPIVAILKAVFNGIKGAFSLIGF